MRGNTIPSVIIPKLNEFNKLIRWLNYKRFNKALINSIIVWGNSLKLDSLMSLYGFLSSLITLTFIEASVDFFLRKYIETKIKKNLFL